MSRRFSVSTLRAILRVLLNQGGRDCLVMTEKRKYWSENSREVDYLRDLSVNGRIMLK